MFPVDSCCLPPALFLSYCLLSIPSSHKNVAADIEISRHLMLSQLIQQLQGNVQLPVCLRLVGLMKRMAVFSETQLRLKFLQVGEGEREREREREIRAVFEAHWNIVVQFVPLSFAVYTGKGSLAAVSS